MLAVVLLGFVSQASAQESVEASGSVALSTDAEPSTDPGAFVVGAEIGAIFPKPFTELGTHVSFGIELGWKLPWLERKLEVFVAAGYSPPERSFTAEPYEAEVLQQELHLSLGPRYRFLPTDRTWNVSLAGGGRLFLLRSFSNGSRAGQPFAEFREQSTQLGFFAALGGEYRIGPGAVLLDLDLGWSGLPHTITGDLSTGNVTATVGYRFFL